MTMPLLTRNATSSSESPTDIPGLTKQPPARKPVDQQKLLSWCQQEYKRCKDTRSSVENQWYLNMAFYFGKQNVRQVRTPTSSTGYALQVPPAPPWRVRLVVNKIRPMIRTMLAKVTAQKPMFTVVPATTEDEDLSAARVAEKIFESFYATKRVKRTIRRAEWWTLICGTGFLKCYWDPSAVDTASNQKGEIAVESITPFHLLVPDLREEELENQPYVIHMTMKSIDWIKRVYGSNVDAVPTKSHDDILQAGFMNLVDIKHKSNEALMLEFWIKPGNPLLPNGGLVTVIGESIVQVVEGYPYRHNEFPFMKLECVPSGKFYADSVIVDLVGLQREYNRTRSQIIEAKNTMSKPKLVAAKGSVNANQITSEPGQVVFYQPGFPEPRPMQMTPLPNYVLEEVRQLQEDMDDISGQHDISRGKNPSQVTAATALSFLQEQDDTKLSDTTSSLEEGVEKLGRHILSHVSQFWTTERTVQIVGRDGSFDAQRFKGSAIGGHHDVRVEAGSALPQSKAAKQAFLMDLMKLGIIPAEKGLEMLELGGIEKVYEDYLVDVRQAQRENQKISQGQPLFQVPPVDPMQALMAAQAGQPMPPQATGYEPNAWDNHELHIQIHNKFRKSQEFELLDDQLKQAFQEHVALHEQELEAKQAGMIPQQGAPVGNGGSPQQGPPQSIQPPAPPS